MLDYTLKDYETIFNFLTDQAVELSDGQWTDFTDGDFGTIIIHLLSYWGDLLSNQLDLTASELFINTAEERTSLMEIVKLIGYEPNNYSSSMASLHITHNTDPNVAYEGEVLPAFSKFVSNSGLSYYNLYPVRLTSDTTIVPTYEGTLTNKIFYYRDITTDGRIQVNDPNMATNATQVEIIAGSVAGEIQRVSDVRFTSGELCFSIHTDLDGYPYIQLPAWWSNLLSDPVTISVTYLKTRGQDGRVGANTINRIASNPSISNSYTINNPEASVGGTNPETVAEIKAKATAFARTMYTAVTLKDFEDIALFSDTISQVRALDYNHKEEEFPPTIAPYKQPTPPNGIPNDAYKVLIMAVPADLSTQTIFTGDTIKYTDDTGAERERTDYGSLTDSMKALHNEYMDRKSATLYLEYRDPVYINPWLIMNIYLKRKEDIRSGDVASSVRDFLQLRFARNRVRIGESIYGSQIGREVLSTFNYINYIEVRDPEYNIEAKPYEFVDFYNGKFMTWVDDELMLVPTGLNLIKISQGDEMLLNVGTEENPQTKSFMWIPKETYQNDTSFIPNSYPYDWDKSQGSYPRPEMEKIGVFWEGQNDSIMTVMVPDKMFNLGDAQKIEVRSGEMYHVYNKRYQESELLAYVTGEEPTIPTVASYRVLDEGTADERIEVSFSSQYAYTKVSRYEVKDEEKIEIKYPDGSNYFYINDGATEVVVDELRQDVLYVSEDYPTFYVPEDYEVVIS